MLKQFHDLKYRLPIGIGLSALSATLIYFAHIIFVQLLLVLVVAALAGIGIWEFIHLLKNKNIALELYLLGGGCIVWILSIYLSLFGQNYYYIPGITLVLFCFASFIFYFNKIEGSVVRIATTLFGFAYIAIPLGVFLKILYPYSSQDGRIWLVYLIAVTKCTDIGAYFIGRAFGKTKLAPELSPKKTLLGAVGGLITGLIVSLLFLLASISFAHFSLTIPQALIYGIVLGIMGQIGDLGESLIKRDTQTKDSNQIPGMGGVLDLLDSLLFNAPVLYLLMKIL